MNLKALTAQVALLALFSASVANAQQARIPEPLDPRLSIDEFVAGHAREPDPALGYDPLAACFLEQIATFAELSDEQRELLVRQGFMVPAEYQRGTFEQVYSEIYHADLPVLITSDSLLHAFHRSFDAILRDLEQDTLAAETQAMLDGMHGDLAARLAADEVPLGMLDAAMDCDVYLTVARALISGRRVEPLHSSAAEQCQEILAAVRLGRPASLTLFDVTSRYDYSQLEPRGHYTRSPVLERYFRAMMWLGRTDLPLVSFVVETGEPVFHRTATEAAFLLGALLDGGQVRPRWERVSDTIGRFVGRVDALDPRGVVAFSAAQGLDDLQAVDDRADAELLDAVLAAEWGQQRILSQIVYTDREDPQRILPRTYQLFPQRFTLDSWTLNQVTHDRLLDPVTGEKILRVLPDPLDVAFVLGNDRAADLLRAQLERFPYQGRLEALRRLTDELDPEFWRGDLYHAWLNALRALDDTRDLDGLPTSMRTQAWSTHTLETQLASWAELRHDTLLYAKPSYAGGISCEYPDAYVEPIPAFWGRMQILAELGLELTQDLQAQGLGGSRAEAYFTQLRDVTQRLEQIAQAELEGRALEPEELEFLRGAIEKEIVGCGEERWDGWFAQLYYDPEDLGSANPVIADVHTAPTDENANEVGWVMHAATGYVRLVILTVDDPVHGPRAFVGPVSSFHTVTTESYLRLTDDQWLIRLIESNPARPAWVQEFSR
jgi:Protein of unknown function (DUF3160)